jgi:hypothetical protein
MGRKPKDKSGEPVRAISVVLTDTQIKNLDANIEKMQQHLISRGVDEKKVLGMVNRSSLLRELALVLATKSGYHGILAGFEMALGLDDSQTDMLAQLYEKEDNTINS